MEKKEENGKLSRFISLILRHKPEAIGIEIERTGGWADVDALIAGINAKGKYHIDRPLLEKIVADDSKGRYSFNSDGTKIRANQGHSIPGVVIEMDSPEPPEYLYHGTAYGFLNKVLKEGLKPMTRQYVHISSDYKTALKVGSRHGKPVVLLLRAKDFVKDGNELYLSPNGILQAKTVPPQYFSACYDESTLPTAEEALQLNREENFND